MSAHVLLNLLNKWGKREKNARPSGRYGYPSANMT